MAADFNNRRQDRRAPCRLTESKGAQPALSVQTHIPWWRAVIWSLGTQVCFTLINTASYSPATIFSQYSLSFIFSGVLYKKNQLNTKLSQLDHRYFELKGGEKKKSKRERIPKPAKIHLISPNILFGKRSSSFIRFVEGKLKAGEGSEFPKWLEILKGLKKKKNRNDLVPCPSKSCFCKSDVPHQ